MDILERIAVALERNNTLLEEGAAGREKVLAVAQAATTAGKKPDPKPKADAPATEEKKPAADTASDGPTVDDVNEAIKAYVGPATRPEEREARKAKVAGVLKKFSPEGTEKPNGATLAVDKRGAFIKTTKAWLEAGDLTTPPAAEEPAEELLDD